MTRKHSLLYAAFLAFCCVAMQVGWVIPDGAGYVSYLASLYLDGDLNFWNEYRASGIITETALHGATITREGYLFTFWGAGTAILWTPLWLLAHGLTHLSHFLGKPWTPNGITIYYNLAARFSTALMGFCALLFTIAIARQYAGKRSAIFGIALTAIGTPFYWYWFRFADVSHVPAAFVVSLFLVVWELFRRGHRAKRVAILLGLLGGLATIVKPNNIFIFIFPLALFVSDLKKQDFRSLIRQNCWIVLGAAICLILQFSIWQILFGNPLGAILEKGVRHYYKFFVGRFHLFDILFSSYHGLFFFSPLLIFSFRGMFLLLKRDWVIGVPALSIVLLQILLMANERYFWEGAAFGLRRVVDWTPLFALGTATAISRAGRPVRILAVIATIWTLLLYLTYSARPPGVLVEYQPPAEILSWMYEAIRALPVRMIPLPAPAAIFFPALLVFGAAGYFLFAASIRLIIDYSKTQTETDNKVCLRKSLQYFLTSLLILISATYFLVAGAAINGEASKSRFERELQWVAERQDRIMAAEEVQFLLHEAKYLALTRSWSEARPSFAEAMEVSPNPDVTSNEIRKFLAPRLPGDEVERYLLSLRTETQ